MITQYAATTRRAFIYTRISLDKRGDGLGVARQLKACRERADALGWDVVAVYEENDTSASKGLRPRYSEMMRRLERGDANALIAWSLDRLTRRPREIEDVLDLATEKGVALATVSGEIDLGSSAGRAMARVAATFARQEVEVKSERQRAANLQRAESGRPHAGRRAFGYSKDGMSVEKSEASEVRWAVDQLLAGNTLRSITRDFAARNVLTTAGGAWQPTELRRMLSNPRYAGILVRRGEEIGRGTWKSLIDVDTHRAVVGILSDPARSPRGAPQRYLLSGIATCGTCGARMYGAKEPRGPVYMCQTRAHVVRRAEPIDQLIQEILLRRLSKPDAARIFSRPESKAEAQKLRDGISKLRDRLDGLAEAYAAGDIDSGQLGSGSRRLRAELSEREARVGTLARSPAVATLVSSQDVEQQWNTLSLDSRRSVLSELILIFIDSPGRGARVFNPDTIRIGWKHE